MNWIYATVGAALAVLASVGLVALSDIRYHAEASEDAIIRLSWRAVSERIEECRIPSEEELAALPPHMRRTEICEGRLAPFQLDVSIDGRSVHSGQIRASGARQDRPTYVFQEFRVSPGRHELKVRFAIDAKSAEDTLIRAPLLLETAIDSAPRSIILVTHEEKNDRLVIRRSEG